MNLFYLRAAEDTREPKINGTTVLQQDFDDATKSAAELASAINTYSTTTGVVAKVEDSGDLTLTAADGRNIEINEDFTIAGTASDDGDGYFGNTNIVI